MILFISSLLIIALSLFLFPKIIVSKFHLEKIQDKITPYKKTFSLITLITAIFSLLKLIPFLTQNSVQIFSGIIGFLALFISLIIFEDFFIKAKNPTLNKIGLMTKNITKFINHDKRAQFFFSTFLLIALMGLLIALVG